MSAKLRTIELDSETIQRLEASASARGLSVAELLAEFVGGDEPPTTDWEAMRRAGRGPWAPEALAEDARRLADFQTLGEGVPWAEVKAWMESWGSPDELSPPKPRKI